MFSIEGNPIPIPSGWSNFIDTTSSLLGAASDIDSIAGGLSSFGRGVSSGLEDILNGLGSSSGGSGGGAGSAHPLFGQFYQLTRNPNFQPDVTGYTLIYIVPPVAPGGLAGTASVFPLLAMEFSPPETTVKATEETSGSSIRIPYATGKMSGGQLSINFIEDDELSVTKFHTDWVNYISDVVYGHRNPSNPTSGELDYATAAYVVKFRPNMRDITYIGQAKGVFPINIPSKELLGSRQTNDLAMIGMNYMCADYNNHLGNSWVIGDFENQVVWNMV